MRAQEHLPLTQEALLILKMVLRLQFPELRMRAIKLHFQYLIDAASGMSVSSTITANTNKIAAGTTTNGDGGQCSTNG